MGTTVATLSDALKVLGNAKRLRLVSFLVKPHYLEEIASELKVARQSAEEHVQQLVEVGVVKRVPGKRETGRVTDYVVVPQRLFALTEELARLGGLQPEIEESDDMRRMTQPLQTGAKTQSDSLAPRLTIVHGMRIGQAVALTGAGPWMIGRDPHAALSLDYDPFVSTRHCELRKTDRGFDVADLYSSNGTLVDGKKLPRGATQPLANGVLLRVGRSLLLFRAP